MRSSGFVCINYRSTSWTNRFLKSLSGLPGAAASHIVVVDNSADDEPFVADRAIDPSLVDIVRAPRNLGYFGGAKLGVDHLRGRHADLDYVSISNVDLDFPGVDFLQRLTATDFPADVGVIAPAILSSLTEADQNPFLPRRPSRRRMHAYKWVFSSYANYLAYSFGSTVSGKLKRRLLGRPTAAAQGPIYAPHGSLMILTRAYFERGGALDYPCFLFGEEIFVAETCAAIGLRVLYRPDLVVRHAEHVTTGVFPNRQMVRYMSEAARYCADTYFARK